MDIWNLNSSLNKLLQGIIALGLISLIAASCGDVTMSSSQQGKAHMNVHLTDAPANYQEVNIDVQGLRIHFTPNSSDTISSNAEKDGKWIDLPVDPMRVNLLDLQNGADTLLASADLEAGHYRELRLILGEDNDVVVDSTTQYLKVPSGQESGYKIKFSADLEEGEKLDVKIDFDASRSVHKAGNSGKYILKPELRAFASTGDSVQAGSIAGTVEPVDANPDIIATMEGDTAATTQPDSTGAFLLEGLEAGNYELSIEPANEDYMNAEVNNVSVEEGEKTDVGTITLEGSH